jgi:HD-GYP domain-containing protein (c-di-GMP phosphodiesterase class II)
VALSEKSSRNQKAGEAQVNMPHENKILSEYPGLELIKILYHLIQSIRIHKDNNELIRVYLSKFKGILNEMAREDDLKIQFWRGRIHIGGEKLPYRRETVNLINQMMKYFSNRGIGGLHFFVASSKASLADLLVFMRLLDISVKQENNHEWLLRRLSEYGFSWVKILRMQDEDLHDSEKSLEMKKFKMAKDAYLHSLETVKEVADKASQGIVGVRKARRLSQTVVDLIQEDSSLIIGLATIRDYDDYTYIHSVNVSLLATCLGRHIGLSKVALEHLSVCGLFHDLGKVGVSKEVLLKKGELSSDEWKNMQRHPLLGVRKILRLNADKALRSRIILGPFEHHLNPDMTGYPKTHFMKKISLLGKILRIADVYEALTAERAYRPRSFTPDEALRKMWSEGEKSFDLILLKSFIRMMGIYPIGSFVELNDGRNALVMDYPEGTQKGLPLVMLLVDDGQGVMTRGEMINLSGQINKEGSTRLKIVRGVRPSLLGVSAARFFLKEQ